MTDRRSMTPVSRARLKRRGELALLRISQRWGRRFRKYRLECARWNRAKRLKGGYLGVLLQDLRRQI